MQNIKLQFFLLLPYCKIEEAQKAGVRILFLCCHVEPDSLEVIDVKEKIGQI